MDRNAPHNNPYNPILPNKIYLDKAADKILKYLNRKTAPESIYTRPLEQFNREMIYLTNIGKLDLRLLYINMYLLVGSIVVFAVFYYLFFRLYSLIGRKFS